MKGTQVPLATLLTYRQTGRTSEDFCAGVAP